LASEPAVRGPTPDKKSKFPTRLAWGYEPTGFGALSALILSLMVSILDYKKSKELRLKENCLVS
jgi:hypothetical protein